ncbi:aldo/keto reductase [Kitasatospora sp. NPDC087314]|uniref:aldo/keto reductase n=1 Tax=Kitasatospora sp. NPDC087314 TaxID=3364068 RepID=UPI00381386ED
MTALLGLGTYRCPDTTEAALMAVVHGANWVDTAPNYGSGCAEALLRPVLTSYPDLRVSTKVGFIPPSAGRLGVHSGVLSAESASRGHCLTPDYITWQTARSRRLLGRMPDIVFLHNPEHDCQERDIAGRLYSAFAALEEACSRRAIGAYGVATWRGFSSKLLNVSTLLQLAAAAGGSGHHLRAIQLPVSLVHLAPVAEAIDGRGVLIEASAAGLDVFASAPLHGGEIPDIVTHELAELISPGATPAQAALSLVASAPGVRRVLLSTSSAEHWRQAADALGRPPLSPDVLRKVVDVLGT